MPREFEIVEVKASTWRCDCHPKANWGYFANYDACPITDLNYGDPASKTYGRDEFASLADLRAAHQNVRTWAVSSR